ncbi:MAG: type II CRISPR-associated endonuclease Cas1 [Actinomycetota bacterium]|nr:MAG: CRISPR-associated [Actinomycetota bacterium]MDO8949843.1 type II CRISPR-associated endonuclease Cas1 [Actinomycetota bacterium]MDP3631288.1 type II CRISPR-associated endonuclease Cas1 [Actinomycetota bacterium]
MAFRTVVISNETELHVQSGQLVVIQERTVRIPLEDIAVLVLEHPRTHVSAAALSLLTEQGVAVAVCDGKHMPTGLLLPCCQHSRQLAVTRQQLGQTQPQRKRLWQRLIRSKIDNQAACLDALHLTDSARLREYSAAVQSGDVTGMEAAAARLYFRRLIPTATRRSPEGPGGSLDYCYAVLRAAIARSLVGHGFYPAVGVHHDSQLNAFNLADDILEPYRPFADYLAIKEETDVQIRADRQRLLSVLQTPCLIQDKMHSVLTAIETTTSSLARAMAERDPTALALPSLIAQAVVPELLPE